MVGLLSLSHKSVHMKTIIFPTDFSANADLAMQYAVDAAKALNAGLLIVNAFDLPYSQNVMSTSLLEIMRETSEKGLRETTKKFAHSGVNFETRSVMGNPIRVVKELVKARPDSLVIMGTKGASGIEEILIGSNTASILHTVSVPVIAIPAKAKHRAINKIVYASDFQSSKNEKALAQLAEIAKAFDAEILILHVQVDEGDVIKPQREKFDKIFGAIPHSYHLEHAYERDVEKVILEFGAEKQADMVALMARKYGLLEGIFHSSMTSKVAYHTQCPFLALHED